VSASGYVKAWADRLGAVVNALHIVDAKALGYEGYDFAYKDLSDLIVRRTADLKYFAERYFGEMVVHQTVLSGSTPDEIEDFAKNRDMDLIMLPREHQSVGSRLLRDSLTAAILSRCTASVWTTEYLEAAPDPSVSNILCAVHFEGDVMLESQNARILEKVQYLASVFHATVTFLQVMKKGGSSSVSQAGGLSPSGDPWFAQVREQWGDSAQFVKKSGDVLTIIRDIAKQVAADLTVVGRTRPGTLGLGVQGHILEIDHVTRRPVLSVW
jgi:nucleotide-binding universal stress UspA family protein